MTLSRFWISANIRKYAGSGKSWHVGKENNLFSLFFGGGGWGGDTEVKQLVLCCLDNLRLTLGEYIYF